MPTTWNLHQPTPTSMLFYHRWAHCWQSTVPYCINMDWVHRHIVLAARWVFALCDRPLGIAAVCFSHATMRGTTECVCVCIKCMAESARKEKREKKMITVPPYGDTILLFKSYTLQSLRDKYFRMEIVRRNGCERFRCGERETVWLPFPLELLVLRVRLVLLCAFYIIQDLMQTKWHPQRTVHIAATASVMDGWMGAKKICKSIARHGRLQFIIQ